MNEPRKRLYDFRDVRLYVVTQPPRPGHSYEALVDEALEGGADAIQLRDPSLPARAMIRLARDLQAQCHRKGALFFLNDRVDVALAADVDGVHLGQEDIPVRVARQMLGHHKLIGCSTHSLAQALTAQGDSADYVSCGPVFSTPTKPGRAAVGLDLVKQYRAMLRLPFVAIGGIDAQNLETVLQAGASRVAVVRAVCDATDVVQAAGTLKQCLLSAMPASRSLFL